MKSLSYMCTFTSIPNCNSTLILLFKSWPIHKENNFVFILIFCLCCFSYSLSRHGRMFRELFCKWFRTWCWWLSNVFLWWVKCLRNVNDIDDLVWFQWLLIVVRTIQQITVSCLLVCVFLWHRTGLVAQWHLQKQGSPYFSITCNVGQSQYLDAANSYVDSTWLCSDGLSEDHSVFWKLLVWDT